MTPPSTAKATTTTCGRPWPSAVPSRATGTVPNRARASPSGSLTLRILLPYPEPKSIVAGNPPTAFIRRFVPGGVYGHAGFLPVSPVTDSNRAPFPYEGNALPNELTGRGTCRHTATTLPGRLVECTGTARRASAASGAPQQEQGQDGLPVDRHHIAYRPPARLGQRSQLSPRSAPGPAAKPGHRRQP